MVVLSHGFWTRQFDADPAVVGTTVGLNGAQHTVVGVLEPDAEIGGLSRIDVWAPLGLDVAQAARDERTLRVAGRLKSGVTLEQATADIQTIARRLEETYPVTNTGWNARVASLWEGTTGPNSPLVLTLLGLVVTFVLLIACANVANLMLARVVTRRKEMALRVAIGAGRFRRVRQLVTESLVLGLLGGGAGLLVARFGLDVIRAFPSEPIFQQIVTRLSGAAVHRRPVARRAAALRAGAGDPGLAHRPQRLAQGDVDAHRRRAPRPPRPAICSSCHRWRLR